MNSPAAMNAAAASLATPQTIHADRSARTLDIGWADGHRTTYDLTTLRWLCPCAFCRGEAGLPGWLDSKPTLTVEQTQLVDIQIVGQYAVAPEWGDGHHTGYYTYALLRDRCPCDDCTARRVRNESHQRAGAATASSEAGHAAHAGHAEHAGHADHADHADHDPSAATTVTSPEPLFEPLEEPHQ